MTQQTAQMENVALIKQAFIDMGVLPETANDADVQDVYFKYMQANHPEVSPNIPHDINSIPRGTLLSHIEALIPTDDSDFDKLVEADADRDVLAEINAQEAETQLRGQIANNVVLDDSGFVSQESATPVSGTTATVISFDSQESTPPTETEVEETENEQTDETLDESESTEGTEQSDSEADLEEAGTEDSGEAASQEEVAQESESDLSLSPQYDNADTDYDTQVTANPAETDEADEADEEGEDGEPQQSPEDYGHEADEEDDGSQVN